MAIVRLRGPLRDKAGGQARHPVPGATVDEVLRALEHARPGLRGWILDERGRVRRHINVFVDGLYAREDTPVGPEDPVDVLPAISGGAR